MSRIKSGHSYHLHLNIAGVLNRSDKDLKGIFQSDKSGKDLTGKQARQWLLYSQNQGKRVLPCGECDNFDYQEGCMGHPSPEQEGSKNE